MDVVVEVEVVVVVADVDFVVEIMVKVEILVIVHVHCRYDGMMVIVTLGIVQVQKVVDKHFANLLLQPETTPEWNCIPTLLEVGDSSVAVVIATSHMPTSNSRSHNSNE